MIAYTKNSDNTINVLGGSSSIEKLNTILEGKDFFVCNDDEVTYCVSGKVMLTADVDEAAEEKAKAEEEKRVKTAQLDAQYQADKAQLMQYYFEFSIAGNNEGMESIKAELEALNQQYDNDLELLKESE